MRLLRLLAPRLCAAAVALSATALAQQATPDGPAFKTIRYEEDWSSLRAQPSRQHLLDPLKYIPIALCDNCYLTLGGDIRERYEYARNPSWGLDPPDGNGYLLQRYMLHADLHLGPQFRIFVQLKSGLANGQPDGPRPPDEDQLDFHQAFVETRLWAPRDGTSLNIRAGRQEVNLGSSRVIGIREGPNVRQSFDGARLTLQHARWSIDVLALRPAETNRGIFDDSPNHKQSFWGIYAAGPLRARKANLDLYYLGLDRKTHRFDQATAREQRHSLGARLSGKPANWDYDTEAIYQFGTFGPARIRAWTAASNTGYTWTHLRLQPRLGLKADVASGDKNPRDQTLGTFNAIYPKGAYFSQADLLGPYNLMDLHPSLTLRITRTLTLTPDADFFWRHSRQDGIYDTPGNLLTSGKTVPARRIGSHANLALEWKATRNLTLEAHYLHFFPGPYLQQVALNRPVNFLGLWATYKF
jgi:hypothetical protein